MINAAEEFFEIFLTGPSAGIEAGNTLVNSFLEGIAGIFSGITILILAFNILKELF